MSDPIFSELAPCSVCPRNCNVDRYEAVGFCRTGAKLKMNLSQLHFGEEPIITGTKGSGTIFLSNCNLRCRYCQNYTISDFGYGTEISCDEMIHVLFSLQDKGAHNVNFVTPSHFTPQLRFVIQQAKRDGLRIPIIWNTNAYEKVEVLRSLEGLVDIYLPDLKYAAGVIAKKYSYAADYPIVARNAIKEMHRQVGKIVMDNNLAVRGMIIRLLVLPAKLAGIRESLYWIAEEIGTDAYISIMGQYYPTHEALQYPVLQQPVLPEDYSEIVNLVADLGFDNGFIQDLGSQADWTPRFKSEGI